MPTHAPARCSNVLLSTDWRASIADLGVSQVVGGDTHKPLGFNRVYAAPEQLMGLHCGLSADIYRCVVTDAQLQAGFSLRHRRRSALPQQRFCCAARPPRRHTWHRYPPPPAALASCW